MIPAGGRSIRDSLERLWTSGTLIGMTDAQLLGRFNEGGQAAEAAFRALVDRHGPMVMGVCRQIARRTQDAEDAFQATFLVLVRKARSVRVGDSLAPWLYGVAYRTAHRARARASRYRGGEVEVAAESVDAPDLDVPPILHEELARLPGKYRDPIVLCHLEGRSHEEAARLLSWPVGTVSGRLSRGRQLLRERLERRGVSVSTVILAGRWTPGAATIPPSLVHPLVGVAAGTAAAATLSNSVQSLSRGVLNAMLLNKIQAVSMVLVATVAASGGVAWATRPVQEKKPADPASAPSPQPKRVDVRKPADPSATPAQAFSVPPMPRRKNSPNLVSGMPHLRSPSIIVAESPDRRSLLALSLQAHKGWKSLPIPEGVTAAPVVGQNMLALDYRGKIIREVAAFSSPRGDWTTVELLEPAEGELHPCILSMAVIYQVGRDIYICDAYPRTWTVLHLKGPEEPKIYASESDIEVLQGNHLHVYNMKMGMFLPGVEVNLQPFRGNAPAEAAR